ncbi:MAG: sucrose-6-phosphate hydrolase [Cardiobacteriaceae bacterium]|nr:sucrose-6-phosphate hydrolase [Cardiobacteriaceae bacterium]
MNASIKRRYRPLNEDTYQEYQALCELASKGIWRQRYHIQPPAGLLNDPNGFVFHQDYYYLCYQWFPLGAEHGLKYWRMLKSDNLATWQDQGIFLSPDHLYDSHGAYSGSALSMGDSILIAYTGNHRDENWVRTPYQITVKRFADGELSEKKPFWNEAPQGYTEHVRDPKIWQENDGSLGMVLGAQRENLTGSALYLESHDGEHWKLKGDIDFGLPHFGYMWECPDYFALNGTDVFTFCPQGLPADGEKQKNLYQCGYVVGHFDKALCRFEHSGFRELDYGFEFYASQSALDSEGRRVMVGWLGLPDITVVSKDEGWAHCLSLPRVLSLKNGELLQTPHPDLQRLRYSRPHNGIHFELLLDNPENEPFVFYLRQKDEIRTRIEFDGKALYFDRSQSGALPANEKEVEGKGGHIRVYETKALWHLQIFADTSSLELFINDGQATMSGRIFPPADANQLSLQHGAGATLTIFSLHED